MGQIQAFSNVSCKNYARRDIYTLVPSSYSLAGVCSEQIQPRAKLEHSLTLFVQWTEYDCSLLSLPISFNSLP